MGVAYNPRIATDGLVLALDAANKKSYPGTGNTWFDLSGNNRQGTLVNSPTFSNENGGIFTFNGATQQANITNNLQFGAISFTLEMVVKIPNLAYEALLSWNVDAFNSNAKGMGLRFRTGSNIEYALNDGAGVATRLQINSLSLNTWYHLSIVHNFNGMVYGYVNGVLVGSIDLSTSGNVSFSDVYDLVLARDANDYGNIFVSTFRVYNRALSLEEVRENFNATRGRYGI